MLYIKGRIYIFERMVDDSFTENVKMKYLYGIFIAI